MSKQRNLAAFVSAMLSLSCEKTTRIDNEVPSTGGSAGAGGSSSGSSGSGGGEAGSSGAGGTSCQPVGCDTDRCGVLDNLCGGTVDCGPCIGSTAVGTSHSCVVHSDARVYCWGANLDGQLGRGTSGSGSAHGLVPESVEELSEATEVAAGYGHSCATDRHGSLWCWGRNRMGVLGLGVADEQDLRATPMKVPLPGSVRSLASAWYTVCAVVDDGSVYCWGANDSAQLGTGTADTNAHPAPVKVSLGANLARRVHVGNESHVCAETDNGLWCWGADGVGQLGSPPAQPTGSSSYRAPVKVPLEGAGVASAGGAHSCAIKGGELFCWGFNQFGQVGVASPTEVMSPVKVNGISAASGVVAADGFTCSWTAAGLVACWGVTGSGQLGDGCTISCTSTHSPKSLELANVVQISALRHACALTAARQVYCWGPNSDGQLGSGSKTAPSAPVLVPLPSP